MLIIRQSPFSGITNEQEIDVTQAQIEAWKGGVLIQIAMPTLTPDEREFIKTGITSTEWEKLYGH